MKHKTIGIFCMILSMAQAVSGQQMKSMDFRNQNIVDILMALAEASGTSIIPDETVRGTASFHFTDSGFEESLKLFLSSYKLYYRREGNVFRVSRIESAYNEKAGLLRLRAEDVDVENLIKALARAINTTVLYDPLPRLEISVDIDGLAPPEALGILIQRLPGYTLERQDTHYYIRHLEEPSQSRGPAGQAITRSGEAYTISLENARFLELIPELFKKAGKEYSLLTKADSVLEHLYFSNKDFDSLLRIILEQGNADYVVSNGIYYIVELQRRDILRKLRETQVIPLNYISAPELPSLLPAELASGNMIKVDKNSNAVLLTGTAEEINPIRAFIERIDQPAGGFGYQRFELKYLNVKDALALVPQKLLPLPPVTAPGSNAFMAAGSPEGLLALEEYIALIDRKDEGYPIGLKYIKTEELLKILPPSVAKEEIQDSGYPNLLFFSGSREKRDLFMRELALIDRPRPQIRYELLVIEYMKNKEVRTTKNFSAAPAGEASGLSFLGSLSNIMNLSFDVVSQFGYQFAANLSIQLGDNTAEVYADTTLNGLSGQEIKFQNTDTYRYQEFEVDADTGNITRTGITREISSGLIVALNGWVSGDDMITISVNATVSKQNNNSSGDTATIPSTSERVVNTQIRTPSGKPIVLSGLMKEDTNKNIKKVPLLGDIPLLGRLFRDQADTKEKTEIVIYIVPYLIRENPEDQDMALRLEGYYQTFIQDYIR
ncbi:MAG: type II and III secretion system protein [Treponema sp.]|jgi:type II secretory pathway component GspD/PulD (secretin)|nr:type II and III secretion system protein [Treponema sp.]